MMELNVKLQNCYIPSEDVVARDVHGEFVIIPIISGVGDADDAIFSLNKFGRAIWDALDKERSLKEVAVLLAAQFDGDTTEIENDVAGLAAELLKRKMIVQI